MPKRTDIFQRLVLEIHRDLGPGWTTAESVELTDRVTGEPREVDIVARATVGGHQIIMSIEVRDRGRPADVAWVEGMAKKHEHLPTNKLVLWSHSGFTSSALEKAKFLGIEAVTPRNAASASWAVLARKMIESSVKWIRPFFSEAVVDVVRQDGSIDRWEAPRTMVFSHADGTQLTVGEIVDLAARSPELRSTLLDHAPDGSHTFHFAYSTDSPCTVNGPGGQVGILKRMLVEVRTETETAPVASRSVLHAGTVTTLAEASVTDGKLRFSIRETEKSSATVRAVYEPEKPERK